MSGLASIEKFNYQPWEIADALDYFKKVNPIFHKQRWTLAVYGSVLTEATGRDLDLIAIAKSDLHQHKCKFILDTLHLSGFITKEIGERYESEITGDLSLCYEWRGKLVDLVFSRVKVGNPYHGYL